MLETTATVQEAIEQIGPAAEIAALRTQLKPAILDEALRAAHDQATAFDAAFKPVSQAIDSIERALAQPGALATGTPEAALALWRSFTAARLNFTAAHYDAEARLNQVIGGLLELQVRKRNLLWSLAAAAGVTAVSFAFYVYLFV